MFWAQATTKDYVWAGNDTTDVCFYITLQNKMVYWTAPRVSFRFFSVNRGPRALGSYSSSILCTQSLREDRSCMVFMDVAWRRQRERGTNKIKCQEGWGEVLVSVVQIWHPCQQRASIVSWGRPVRVCRGERRAYSQSIIDMYEIHILFIDALREDFF